MKQILVDKDDSVDKSILNQFLEKESMNVFLNKAINVEYVSLIL